jgi:hypothetical protein
MTVRGHWDSPLCQAATTKLHKCLAEHPEALIVDLSDLDDPYSASAPTWMSVRRTAAAREPAVHLALCIPPHLPLADRLQRLGVRRFLPVYATVRQARVAIAGRLPLVERVALTLPPEPESPGIARNLIGDACLAWGLRELVDPSRLVMSELVTNAVEHAGTPIVVVVSRRGAGMHLMVSDGVAAPPRLHATARPQRDRPPAERGRGGDAAGGPGRYWASMIMPAPTVRLVLSSTRMKPPVVRLRRYSSASSGTVVRSRIRPISLS